MIVVRNEHLSANKLIDIVMLIFSRFDPYRFFRDLPHIIFPILYVCGTINTKYCDDSRRMRYVGIQCSILENGKVILNKF